MASWYEKMKWFVFVNSMSNKEIKKYNIFDHSGFYDGVVKKLKKCETKEEFAEELRRELFYYYGSKCEWEVVITHWPPRVTKEELLRLDAERSESKEKYNKEPVSLGVELEPALKVDVYTQVFNNWDVFLDYVWSFKRTRSKKTEKTAE